MGNIKSSDVDGKVEKNCFGGCSTEKSLVQQTLEQLIFDALVLQDPKSGLRHVSIIVSKSSTEVIDPLCNRILN
jgi:hypothetical protein